MTGPAVVWFVVGLLTVTVIIAFLVALIRHVIVLGRAAGRFQAEAGPILGEISEQASRAASTSRDRSTPPLDGR